MPTSKENPVDNKVKWSAGLRHGGMGLGGTANLAVLGGNLPPSLRWGMDSQNRGSPNQRTG